MPVCIVDSFSRDPLDRDVIPEKRGALTPIPYSASLVNGLPLKTIARASIIVGAYIGSCYSDSGYGDYAQILLELWGSPLLGMLGQQDQEQPFGFAMFKYGQYADDTQRHRLLALMV